MIGRSGLTRVMPALVVGLCLAGAPAFAGGGDGAGDGDDKSAKKTKRLKKARKIERRIELRSSERDGRFEGVIVEDGKARRFTSRGAFEKAMKALHSRDGVPAKKARRVHVFKAIPTRPAKSRKTREAAPESCPECKGCEQAKRVETLKSIRRRIRVEVGPDGETRTLTLKGTGEPAEGCEGSCEEEIDVIVEGEGDGAGRRKRVIIRELPNGGKERLELLLPDGETRTLTLKGTGEPAEGCEGSCEEEVDVIVEGEGDGAGRRKRVIIRKLPNGGEERLELLLPDDDRVEKGKPRVRKRVVIRKAHKTRKAHKAGEAKGAIRERIEIIVPEGSCRECLKNRLRERAPNMLERWSHGAHPPLRWVPKMPDAAKRALEKLPKELPPSIRKQIEKAIRERHSHSDDGGPQGRSFPGLEDKFLPGFDLGELQRNEEREVIIVPGHRLIPSRKSNKALKLEKPADARRLLREMRRRVKALQREIEELERSLVKPRGSLWF